MLIHIGYHKTGTTWLQRSVMQPHCGFAQIADHKEVDQLLIRPHGLLFNPDTARRDFIERRLRLPPGLVPTISSENLSGHPFFGGTGSDVLAQRLAQVFPTARILITIRSQFTLLPSLYMQYLRRGGTLPATAFFAGEQTPGYAGFAPEHFEFHRLIALYQSLFAEVAVLTQEGFQTDPQAALHHIQKFAGAHLDRTTPREIFARQGTSAPLEAAPILRRLNHVRRSVMTPAPILPLLVENAPLDRAVQALIRRLPIPGKTVLRSLILREFGTRFNASNRELDQLTQRALDLTDYPQIASSPCFQGSELTSAAGPIRVL